MAKLKIELEKQVKITDLPKTDSQKEAIEYLNAKWDEQLKSEVDEINGTGSIFLDDHVQLYRDVNALLL
jgi:hypothetical protein